jgi:hypothetical protein
MSKRSQALTTQLNRCLALTIPFHLLSKLTEVTVRSLSVSASSEGRPRPLLTSASTGPPCCPARPPGALVLLWRVERWLVVYSLASPSSPLLNWLVTECMETRELRLFTPRIGRRARLQQVYRCNQSCGSGMFIQDSGSEIFHAGSALKNLSILTQKNDF